MNYQEVLKDLHMHDFFVQQQLGGETITEFAERIATKMWHAVNDKAAHEAERDEWIDSLNRAQQWIEEGFSVQYSDWVDGESKLSPPPEGFLASQEETQYVDHMPRIGRRVRAFYLMARQLPPAEEMGELKRQLAQYRALLEEIELNAPQTDPANTPANAGSIAWAYWIAGQKIRALLNPPEKENE